MVGAPNEARNPSERFFINSLIHVPYVVEDLTHTDETRRNHTLFSSFHPRIRPTRVIPINNNPINNISTRARSQS